MFSKDLAPRAISIVMLCALVAPVPAVADATLDIIQGSGEFQTFRKSITLGAPEAIAFRWSTDQANATGGTWKVTEAGSPQILASGESAPAPKPGHIAWFTIPAGSFLKGPAPSPGVTYSITITPHDGMNNALGNASGAVAVIYEKQSPAPPVTFGPSANFPDIELVHYSEQIGQVPLTQLLFANATVIVRAVNNSGTKTDPFNVAVTDFNVLMKQTDPVQKIGALNPGMPSGNITVHLTAMLPPPKSQLGQEQQIAEWKAEYKNQCGVDLRATLDWAGPQAQAPMNDHAEQYLYLGYGDSKSWDEGYAAKKEICDANECINLNDMARYVYKQLACKVVGYAFFVGDQTSGPRGVFRAYGEARTSLNGIPIAFSPDTQMQIASASKVLTALAGMRVFDGHLEDFAFKSFPSNWTLPNNSIVKKIRFREFLSQTSGVQQYYPVQNPLAGPDETFAGLQTFYTQTLANPNAPFFCPGPPNPKAKPPVPLVLPNPIISNKSPCYSNANFAIMRLVMPRFGGTNSNDPATLADTYVQQVQQNVFTPVGGSNVACKPSGDYALLYVYPGNKLSGDWADTPRLACGSWGWYVSVRDYAKVLVSLNSADHKILSDCQFLDMETNPSSHPVGWDIKSDGATGLRWLEKNGAEGTANGSTQTTSVGIYLGSPGVKKPDGKCTAVSPGVAGVLFINSDISGQPKSGASAILTNAFRVVVKPK